MNIWSVLLWSIAELLSLASMILVGVWMFQYHDGFLWKKYDLRKFNFHPLFMTIAFIGLALNGALVYRVFDGLNISVNRMTQKIIHALLHLSALVFAATGLTAVIQFHNEQGYENFYSGHSWCGLTICGLFSLQFIVGFVSFLFPRLPNNSRVMVFKVHTFSGTAIVLLGILTTITGVLRKSGFLDSLHGESILANCLTLVLICLFAVMLFLLKPKRNDSGYAIF